MNRGRAGRRAVALGAAVLVSAAGGLAVLPAATASPAGVGPSIKAAIAAEKRALKAFDSDKAAAKRDLEQSLSDLKDAVDGLPNASGRLFSDLKQAVMGDEIALRFLNNPTERDFARGRINIAILRKETALGIEEKAPQTTPPPAVYPNPDPKTPPPPPKPKPSEQPGSPNDFLRVLELMDKRLKADINNLEGFSLTEDETKAAVDAIAALKTKAIALLPPVCGLDPLQVYPVIEAVEKDVVDAYYTTDHARSLASLAAAQRTLQALDAGIVQVGQCPQAHDALTQLIAALGALQTTEQPENSYRAAIKTLLNETMLQTWKSFPSPFGLSFAFVSRTLNLLDYHLDQANAFAGWNFEAAIRLARAQKYKVRLENAFRLVISTTVGPPTITGGQ
jgi:hypothetical protein